NATVLPPNGGVGRKGMDTSVFLGYTSTATGSGFSWAMAGYLNDFGIANMAQKLSAGGNNSYAEEAEYFLNRSQNYVNLFDPSINLCKGRAANGAFRLAPASYDPSAWSDDYTETDGWNMAFDAPYDGQGLVNLYGGKDKLAAKLDALFAAPPNPGDAIHEMVEARDVRVGQLGMSNEPSSHIIYMYDYAGQPTKAQA